MKMYSVKEISEMLDANPETVRRWIRAGKLKADQYSRKDGNMVQEDELYKYLRSTSKYAGIADGAKVDEARNILIRSTEINQMMKVVGEEGISAEDYITYQKGELLDAAYLQQDSFDPIDAACGPERQLREFRVMYDILISTYALENKNDIRMFFNELRQLLLDWHTIEFNTEQFDAQEKQIKAFYMSKSCE